MKCCPVFFYPLYTANKVSTFYEIVDLRNYFLILYFHKNVKT